MALTDEQVLQNEALGLIGEYEIEDGDTSSKQYLLCERFYEFARDRTLVSHLWNEAEAMKTIPQEKYSPIFGYSFKYPIPDDCLRAKSINADSYDWDVKAGYIVTDYSRSPSSWSSGSVYVAGQYVSLSNITYLCNVSHTAGSATSPDIDDVTWTTTGGDYAVIDLSYIKQLTDVTEFSELLRQSIVYRLATLIVVPLTGNMDNKRLLLEEFEKIVMPQARSIDARQGKPRKVISNNISWLKSRNF